MRPFPLLRSLIIVASLFPVARASAQRDDAAWLAECRRERDWGSQRERHCEIREVRLAAPGGTLTVDGLRNGGVTVIGWDRDSLVVKTRIQAQAPTQREAAGIAAGVRTEIRGSRIRPVGPTSGGGSSWTVNYVIWVPRRSDLHLRASNGPLSITDVNGDIDAQTRNGPLSLAGLAGSVHARTTNGPLSIRLSGRQWDGQGLDARTSNGPLQIVIPEGYSARLETGTTNGPMSLGFPVTVVGRIGRSISTDLGSGGALIRAYTTNGPLSITRR